MRIKFSHSREKCAAVEIAAGASLFRGKGITNINKKKSDSGKEIWYNRRSMTYLCPADFVLCREVAARIEGLGTNME
jgi:hypothetical protein